MRSKLETLLVHRPRREKNNGAKNLSFLRSYHPPHIFPVKRALFQALFCWVGKSIMRMQIRGEKCKSPFPSHLVSFDFCAFWKFVRFSQPFKKTGGRKEYGEKLGKEVCRLFLFFFFLPLILDPRCTFFSAPIQTSQKLRTILFHCTVHACRIVLSQCCLSTYGTFKIRPKKQKKTYLEIT